MAAHGSVVNTLTVSDAFIFFTSARHYHGELREWCSASSERLIISVAAFHVECHQSDGGVARGGVLTDQRRDAE